MRIECVFRTEKIPVSYQYMFASIVKGAISTFSKEKFDEIYHYDDKKTKQSKSFTFSVFMKKFELAGEHFELKDDLKFILSTPDSELMLYIYNGLLSQKEYQYKGYQLSLVRVNLLKEQLPEKSEAIFKTLSPIAIKDKDGKFLAPDADEYGLTLNYVSNQTLQNVRGYGLKEPLIFTPIDMKRQVVKLKHEEFATLNDQHILYVNAYRGMFKLEGAPEDLAFLTQTGIGFRRSSGFGNVQFLR